MFQPYITPLPYTPDSTYWFEKIRQLPWPVFLDSNCSTLSQNARYDILTANPVKTFLTRLGITSIVTARETQTSTENPFWLLKQELKQHPFPMTTLPFCGGALGYFGYDLLRGPPPSRRRGIEIPEMAVGIYDWALIVDHQEQTACLVSVKPEKEHTAWMESFNRLAPPKIKQSFALETPFKPDSTVAEYADAFEKVKNYLQAGDCYQVNLAIRFSATAKGDPWLAYQTLRNIHPAPFAGYFEIPKATLLSFSPERFIQVQNQQVTTCPIKGTRPRKVDLFQDTQLKKELQNSTKDKAENVMIVDLMRNDLGKICVPGSIRVPHLFAVHSFTAVHHLVSTVTGTLPPEYDALDMLQAAFPGGSITGAPKIRAMEIIKELEPHARTLYTGNLAYISFDGKMDSNILIRSLVHHRNNLYAWAGGGIVADSRCTEEYQEIHDKIGSLLDGLQRNHTPRQGHADHSPGTCTEVTS